MKISFNKSDLSNGLNIVTKAVPSNTTMPLLKCVLIEADSNGIKFISNDTELAIETVVPGTVYESGVFAVDAKLFFDIVRKLSGETVDIEVNDRFIASLKCGTYSSDIPGQDGSDFPYPPEIDKDYSIGISQFSLKEMIRQTIFSINFAEKNMMMTGEMFEIKNNVLRLVSLDGHRIALRNLKLGGTYEDKKAIVPGKSLNEISKILSSNLEDQVKIYFSENLIMFEFGDTRVYSRLIEGDYFHIDRMLSGDSQTKIEVDKNDFMECLERACLFIREGEGRPVILNITDGQMEVSVETTLGSMQEPVGIVKEGEDLRIGFNPRLLIDALRVIDDEKIKIYLLNRKAPCYIRDDEESYIYLVLPINIL